MHAHDHVLDGAEVFEEPDVLERSGDTKPGDAMCGQAGELVRLEPGSA
jgi:hypothetical protein